MDSDGDQARQAWLRSPLDRHEHPLIGYATRLTGDAERARDVVQETFIRLCAEDRAQVDGHVTEWPYTVCRRRALDVRRKETRMRPCGAEFVELVAKARELRPR